MKKYIPLLDKVIFYGILFLIFSVPLFFSRFFDLFHIYLPFLYTNIIFGLPKTVLFIAVTDILFLLFLLKSLLQKKYSLPTVPKLLLISIVGLSFFSLISTLLSDVPLVSFFGQYERMEGLVTCIHYLLFFFLIMTSIKKEDMQKIWTTIMLSSLLVALYGILQGLGMDTIMIWSSEALKGRVFSTLGHPNYLGYFFIFSLPISIYLFQSLWKEDKFFLKTITGFSIIFQLTALFLTGSRGAILGLILASILVFLLFLLITKKKKVFIISIITICVTTLIGGLIIVNTPLKEKLRLDTTNMRSVNSRLVIWKDSVEMIKNRPWFGYGLDTYMIYFPYFKSQELLDLEQYEQNADRAHNTILDTLQNIGIVGTFFYLLLFISLFSLLLKLFKERKKEFSITLSIIFFAFFFANLWGFPVTAHTIYFWLLIGIIVMYNSSFFYIQQETVESLPAEGGQKPAPRNFSEEGSKVKTLYSKAIEKNDKKLNVLHNTLNSIAKHNYLYKIIFTVLIIFTLWSFFFHINVYSADHLFYEAIQKNNISLMQKSAEKNPFNPVYLQAVYSMTGDQNVWEKIESIMRGKDYQTQLLQAYMEVRNKNTEHARTIFQQLSATFPHIPDIYFSWGEMGKNSGNFSECIAIYEKLLSISPQYWKYDLTIKEQPWDVQERYRLFFKENPNFRIAFENLSFCSIQNNDLEKALIYAPHINESPYKYLYLSQIAEKMGQPETAQKYLEKCKTFKNNSMCNNPLK